MSPLVVPPDMRVAMYAELRKFFIEKQEFSAAAHMRDLEASLKKPPPTCMHAGIKDGRILMVHPQEVWIKQTYEKGYLDGVITVLVTPTKSV